MNVVVMGLAHAIGTITARLAEAKVLRLGETPSRYRARLVALSE